MKKTLNLTVWLIIACTFYWACKKDQNTANNKNLTTEEQELIANAKTYFETNVQNTIQGKRLSDVTDTTAGQFNPIRSLLKSADWDNAYTLKLSIGKVVVAPIKFSDSLYARPANTDSTTRLSINNLVKLILYKDSAKQLHVEVVTAFPDSNFLNNPTGTFSGIAFVQDWQGNYLRSFSYQNGQIFQLKLNDSAQQQTISTSAIMPPPTYNDDCASIGWFNTDYGYDDAGDGDGYSSGAGCIDLNNVGGGGGESSGGSGAPSNGDYGGIAGSGGSASSGGNSANGVSANFIFLAPKTPVSIVQELKCFTANSSSTYSITLCVEEPGPGTGESASLSSLAGHTYLTFEQDNKDGSKIIRSDGFYPSTSANPFSPSSPSTFGDNSSTGVSASIKISVNSKDFMTVVQSIKNQTSQTYNLYNYNCTTSALNALASASIGNLPAYQTGSPFTGGTPGALGWTIRNLDLDVYSQLIDGRQVIRNISSTNSILPPVKQGTCNPSIIP